MKTERQEHILIVDDHPVVLDGIHLLLSSIRSDASFSLLSSGDETMDIIKSSKRFDWAFIDINLPDIKGLDLIDMLKPNNRDGKMIVLSSDIDAETIYLALSKGAHGVLSKSHGKEIFELCFMTVELGKTFLTPEHASELSYYKESFLNEKLHVKSGLSKRQKEVLILLAKGYSNKEISQQMDIVESTVKSHISSLMDLFEANNRGHCVEKARRLKIL